MKAIIRGIDYCCPKGELSNEDLAREFPEWSMEKVEKKTGIRKRAITSREECASDLALEAGRNLLRALGTDPKSVDFLLFCTQSPDYYLPTTACLLQEKLGLSTSSGAFDFNLGCSGYIYGLSVAKGLIETEQARNVLLLTGETYSKYIHPKDRSVRTIFGDAGTATILEATDSADDMVGPFVFGTDGRGGKNLIVPRGGSRKPVVGNSPEVWDENGNVRSEDYLYMNGPEIFTFTGEVVPGCVNELLAKAGKKREEIDKWVLHQANAMVLDFLRVKLGLSREKFIVEMADFGNTVSGTIPIALRESVKKGKIKNGDLCILVGFGVGYSWGGCMIRAGFGGD
jgi:3-oxoacyl-[acyl-carrier-protein] synthase III